MARRILIICMTQVTVITIPEDGEPFWEIWAMGGHQDRLGDGVWEAYQRMQQG